MPFLFLVLLLGGCVGTQVAQPYLPAPAPYPIPYPEPVRSPAQVHGVYAQLSDGTARESDFILPGLSL
jgi:hypothetical protein